MYASAMLRLHRECGGNAWLKRFCAILWECPEVKPDSKEAGLRQSLGWYAAASLAAARDLSPTFCDRWRLQLSPKARKAAAAISWKKPGLKITDVLEAIR